MEREGLDPSEAILDYGLIHCDHSDIITSFVIDDQARYLIGTDHALLIADIQPGLRPCRYRRFPRSQKTISHYAGS